jgi:preprotein translocase subunit SecG
MPFIESLMLMIHVLVAVGICGFVLLQHGKGADMGAAFGSGASGTVFGATGSANFLSRTTAILATVFFVTSLGLTWYGSTQSAPKGVMDEGVMSKAPAPAKASDVPSAPQGLPAAVPATEPAKAAPGAPAPAGSKSGDVPK